MWNLCSSDHDVILGKLKSLLIRYMIQDKETYFEAQMLSTESQSMSDLEF